MVRELDHWDWFLFDLDGTLWDHESASHEAIMKVCNRYGLPPLQFLPYFKKANLEMWRRLEDGHLDFKTLRVRRFEMAIATAACGCSANDAQEMSEYYLSHYLSENRVLPGATEILTLLHEAGKKIGIITNGSHQTQDIKLSQFKMDHVFAFILCSDSAQSMKPSPFFFQKAFDLAGAERTDRVLVIGDSLRTDIEPAANAGCGTAFVENSKHNETLDPSPTYRFADLNEFQGILS